MEPERWKRVKAIFTEASELPAAARAEFLDRACGEDEALRREVENLLAQIGDTQTAEVFAARPQHSLQAGDLLAERFRIVRFLGRGGMGEVYEASDEDLHGVVALKVLRPELSSDPEFLGRFRREAQLARKVTHPNVCRIFDVGYDRSTPGQTVFLTMEFLDGETLAVRMRRRGKSTPAEALPLIRQMAAGLEALHAQGIVHRDFKPGNIMVVSASAAAGERTVITDFGLARAMAPAESGASITHSHRLMGTPDYMAPEQLLGEPATAASDVYALGLVIYELVTGRKAFPGGRHRLLELPTPPREHSGELDAQWNGVILRCLARDPAQRPGSPSGVVEGLEGATQTVVATPRRKWVLAAGGAVAASLGGFGLYRYLSPGVPASMVVLPFANEGPPEDEALCDGLTEGLIDGIASTGAIRVIARSAVFRLKDVRDPFAVARQLGVAALLVGRMKRNQDTVSVTAELADAGTAQQLWNQQFTASMSGLQSLPAELVDRVLRVFGIRRSRTGPGRRPADGEAYKSYLRGRHALNRREPNAFVKAQEWFQKAIDIDPTYAAPYAGLADVYSLQSGGRPPNDVCPKAKAAALRALELDGALAEGHTTLGFVQLHYEWAWAEAENSFQRALGFNPSYASAHSYFARWLTARKRFAEAETEQRRAMELDPLSPALGTALGVTLYHARRWEEAERELRRVLADQPRFIQAVAMLGVVRMARKDLGGAIADFEKALQLIGEDDYGVVSDWSMAQALSGNPDKARDGVARVERIAANQYMAPCFLAGPLLALGERERALAMLERSVDPDRSWPVFYYGVEPKLDPLRGEPRFVKFLERIGLAT